MNFFKLAIILAAFLILGIFNICACSNVNAQNKIVKFAFMFDDDAVGNVPLGWAIGETNSKGTIGTWKVVKNNSAPSSPNVISLSKTANSGGTYNLLVSQKAKFKDVNIGVKVKALSGKEDQGGGPIWRAKDNNNYYVARWNPLENNFRVYFVKDSKRKQIASAKVNLNVKAWHEITIRHIENKIIAKIDGKKVIEIKDNTFLKAGKVGLWTKADAATLFDNFKVENIETGK